MRKLFTDWDLKLRGFFRSATMRFNLLLLILVQYDAEIIGFIAENQPDILSLLPDNLYKMMGVVVVVGNLYLRAKTTASLADRGAQAAVEAAIRKDAK